MTHTRICSNGIAEDSRFFLTPDFAVNKGKMRLGLMICFSAALWGCSSITGTPKPAIDTDYTITRYREDLMRLADKPPSECGGIKQGINKALTVMDLRYAEFVDDISVESKTKATTTDFLLVGLGLAGTAVGGAGAKTVFNALSTGVASMNTSIDKNFFYEKTLPALIAKMNADRKQQQLLIIERLKTCDRGGYSWFEAVHDLTDYYSAGTLLGAIASVSKDAGVKQTDSETKIMEAVTFGPSVNTSDKLLLRSKLKTPEGRAAIMTCWKQVNPQLWGKKPESRCAANGPPDAPEILVHVVECAGDQSKVLECLND